MIKQIKHIWKVYGSAVIILVTLAILIILSITRVGKKGTYTDIDYYNKILEYLPDRKRYVKPQEKSITTDSKPELLCRKVLENYFNIPFSKSRPDFLRNPVTGNNYNLEIDCYNPSLRLGVEYNGQQHYNYIPFFHRNKDAFMNQKYRDELKRRMCSDNGITLLEIPYTVKYNNIPMYLLSRLKSLGY